VRALTAFYDLSVGPVSFDFVVFMLKAELAKRRCGAERLHMVIVPFTRGVAGMFRDKTQLYDEHEMRWRLWNICIPACSLIDASVTLATDWDQAKRLRMPDTWPTDWDRQTLKDRRHLIGDIIAAARNGMQVPLLGASEQARRKVREAYGKLGKPVVTVTLRSTYLRERNSDRGMWQRAMQYIESKGYAVAVLEDTGVALSNGVGYGELNLDVRMACYQEAVLNLQANNGAASLCWFSDKPYRMFAAGVPADEWNGLFVAQGLPLGESWPWAGPQQKLVYGQTTLEQVIGEFDAWASETK
jgi:hypothetical protein